MNHGTVRTSAIVIATGRRTSVYRTLEEVPPRLRRKLAQSTSGSNAATVIIADRRGAEELLQSRVEPTPARSALVAFIDLYWKELLLAGLAAVLLAAAVLL
jgi:hypothetical protein